MVRYYWLRFTAVEGVLHIDSGTLELMPEPCGVLLAPCTVGEQPAPPIGGQLLAAARVSCHSRSPKAPGRA